MKILISMILLCCSLSVSATQNKIEFSFNGGNQDSVQIAKNISVTKYRSETYTGTCYHSEPYDDISCRYETNYRQECTYGPSRQVCRYVPAQRICRTVNGRQECRQRSGRNVCETKPGHRTCRRVPYSEYECRDTTSYRQVAYSCQKVRQIPYQENEDVSHKVNIEYLGSLDKADANFVLNLSREMKDFETVVENLNKELVQVNFKVAETKEVSPYNYESNLKIEFYDLKMATLPTLVKLVDTKVSRKGKITIELENFSNDIKSLMTDINIMDLEKNKVHFRKEIDILSYKKEELENGNVIFKIDLKEFGFKNFRKSIFAPFEREREIEVIFMFNPLKPILPGKKIRIGEGSKKTEVRL